MKKTYLFSLILTALFLQGCVHKVVTVPVKVAYKTTKGIVKGGVAVGKAIIPGDSKKDDDEEKDD